MSKILKKFTEGNGRNLWSNLIKFDYIFLLDHKIIVIKFLKSRVEPGTIRGQQPELREMRVLIAVVFCRLEFLV